jgi:hypothetical protein
MKFLALSETFKHILKNDTVLFNHWIPKAHVEIKKLTINRIREPIAFIHQMMELEQRAN